MTERRFPVRMPPRVRLVLARTLTVLGVLFVVVSVVSNFVRREALDADRFRETSSALLADEAIRAQISATIVDRLYANVDVAAALEERLPDDLQPLAGPLAGVVRDAVERAATDVVSSPRAQASFVEASSFAQRQFVALLDDDLEAVATTDGRVVLDLRPLVLELGNRFSFVSDLETRVSPDESRITILESGQLETAQEATSLLRLVASWVWILAVASWAGALWLARDRRRLEVRAIALGLVCAGLAVVVVRALVGRYVTDELVTAASVRPAAASAYDILTELLAGGGWTIALAGLVGLLWAWVSGPGRRASAARRSLAPYLRRPELAYGGLVAAYLLLLWWRPTPQFGIGGYVLFYFLLAVLGLETLRRAAGREFPDAPAGQLLAGVRAALGGLRRRPAAEPSSELERLARLHADGALDDAEYSAAKARVLGA